MSLETVKSKQKILPFVASVINLISLIALHNLCVILMQLMVALIKDLHCAGSQMNNFPTYDFNIHRPKIFLRAGWTHRK
jgi:hypothetical protein